MERERETETGQRVERKLGKREREVRCALSAATRLHASCVQAGLRGNPLLPFGRHKRRCASGDNPEGGLGNRWKGDKRPARLGRLISVIMSPRLPGSLHL